MSFVSGEQLSELVHSQLVERKTEINDAVAYNSPLWDLMRPNFKSYTGRKWEHVINILESDAPETVVNEDVEFTIKKNGQITELATYEWESVDVSQITLSYLLKAQNGSREMVYDLVKVHTESVKNAAAKSMARKVYQSGNNMSVIDLCDGRIPVIGGIDATVYPNWTPTTMDFEDSGDGTAYPTAELALEDFYLERQKFATGGMGKMVCGRNLFKRLRQEIRERSHLHQLGSDGKTIVGFQTLVYDGMEISFDPMCPDDVALWLDQSAIDARYLGDDFLKAHSPVAVPGSDATKATLSEVIPVVSICSVGTRNRRALGSIVNISPPDYT